MAFKTVTAALLAGGITLGAIVMWDGGAIIDNAQEMIQEQAAELNLFGQQQKQMVAKIQEMRAELEDLYANGTPKDQARIAELETAITEAEAAVTSDTAAVKDHIEKQAAQMAQANADAKELEETMVAVGDTPEAMTEREFQEALNGEFVLPEGYKLLQMFSGTPQIVPNTYNELTIDKTIAEDGTKSSELTITSKFGGSSYVAILDGNKITVNSGSTVSLGMIADLEGSLLEVQSTSGNTFGKFYLSAE